MRITWTIIVAVLAVYILLLAGRCCAATTRPTTKDTHVHDALLVELTSGDSARVAAAVTGIKKEARKHIKRAQFLEILVEAKLFAEAESAAQEIVIADPGATLSLEGLEKFRATTLLAAGKPAEALVAAKAYYNVCTLKNTADAIDLLSICLAAARPHDTTVIHRFKRQQVLGATTEPISQTEENLGESVIAGIPLDPKPYEAAIAKIVPQRFQQFGMKGNLLLLSGREKEARELFEQAVDLAPEKAASEAIENVARALRAEAGCVGPANAYILKLRSEQ